METQNTLWIITCHGCVVDRVEYNWTLSADYVKRDLIARLGFSSEIRVRVAG